MKSLVVGLMAAAAATAPTSASAQAETSGTVSRIIVQSHRGAGALAPENTIEAFELGWELETWPEADLRTTTDGVIVAFHDATFDRVTKDLPPELKKKGVADVTWETLSKLQVGEWKDGQFSGHQVPKMAEIFARMKGHPERHLYLDIKNVDFKDLAALVREHGVESQVILSTPRYDEVREWKKLVPNSKTLLWMGGQEPEIAEKLKKVREAGFEGLTQIQMHVHLKKKPEEIGRDSTNPFSPSDQFLREAAAELEERGIILQTFPWGGTTRDIYWKLLDLGVDAFATDHPKVTLDAVNAYVPAIPDTQGDRK